VGQGVNHPTDIANTGILRFRPAIYGVLIQDGQVIKSELVRHPVTVADTIGATQFVFTDTSIALPMPVSRRTLIYAGYDEGPYNTP
jgi:hypothetical protein